MNKVFLALGSNLGRRGKNLTTARKEIKKFATILKKSKVHETKPEGYLEQGKFLNQVIEIETQLEPLQLLITLHEIEHKMGRTREIKNGPRTIDLDILTFNKQTIDQQNLKIPHPRMFERKFVSEPLSEITDINELRKNLTTS